MNGSLPGIGARGRRARRQSTLCPPHTDGR